MSSSFRLAIGLLLVLGIGLLLAGTSPGAQSAPHKPSEKVGTSENVKQSVTPFPAFCQNEPSDLRCSNLVFYSPKLWVVPRFDAQDFTFAVVTSDRDGPGLWDAKIVFFAHDPNQDKVTIRARTVLRSITSLWLDWIDWKITIDKDLNAVIEEITQDRKVVIEDAKALPLATFNTHKFP